jgi:hypothetical protein
MESSRLTRTLCDVVLVLVAKLWREGNWILESLRWKGIRYFWISQSCRVEWEYRPINNRYPYREILQHRSLTCHRLLCRNESRLPPYHASEQAHRGGGLRRTWLIGRSEEDLSKPGAGPARHLIFVDTNHMVK